MNYFLKTNKSLVIYPMILLVITTFFGLNFIVSFIGNILLLLLLIPLLLLLTAFISLNSLKSKLQVCDNCGNISLGSSNNCTNCGFELNVNNEEFENPSKTTIEVKAEEIK